MLHAEIQPTELITQIIRTHCFGVLGFWGFGVDILGVGDFYYELAVSLVKNLFF